MDRLPPTRCLNSMEANSAPLTHALQQGIEDGYPRSPVPSSVTVVVESNADEADDADQRGGSTLPVIDLPRS